MTVVKEFRETTHGDEYKLSFEETDSGFVVQVLSHPKIPNGATALEAHLMPGNKLDLPTTPTTMKMAMGGALHWIAYFSKYIRTRGTDQTGCKAHTVK